MIIGDKYLKDRNKPSNSKLSSKHHFDQFIICEMLFTASCCDIASTFYRCVWESCLSFSFSFAIPKSTRFLVWFEYLKIKKKIYRRIKSLEVAAAVVVEWTNCKSINWSSRIQLIWWKCRFLFNSRKMKAKFKHMNIDSMYYHTHTHTQRHSVQLSSVHSFRALRITLKKELQCHTNKQIGFSLLSLYHVLCVCIYVWVLNLLVTPFPLI